MLQASLLQASCSVPPGKHACMSSLTCQGKNLGPLHSLQTPSQSFSPPEDPAVGLQKWGGKPENKQAAQDILVALAKANSEAQLGQFKGPHPVPGGGRILQVRVQKNEKKKGKKKRKKSPGVCSWYTCSQLVGSLPGMLRAVTPSSR